LKYAWLPLILLRLFVPQVGTLAEPGQTKSEAAPYAILWPHPPNHPRPHTPVGLLYTPEILAVMAEESPSAISARIATAIREQTPIVVLWTIPPTANSEPWPRPFSTVIVDGRGDSFGYPNPGMGVRIEPLWVEQHADDLRQLDRRTPFLDVGVMAAYPRAAFVSGRLVTIYRRLPAEPGRTGGVQRFGLIQWSGVTY
jgi:hypothetical protein